tara:strand:- start:734 stop:1033 length:300 start_codon:yes stop_codon:yes gene_type:complete
MNENDLYYLVLESLIEEAELNEFSTMSGGAVGISAVPLGAGPRGRVTYRDGNDKSDSAYKEKPKKSKKKKKRRKKKTYTRSVQHYLKHGGEKTRKRSFK